MLCIGMCGMASESVSRGGPRSCCVTVDVGGCGGRMAVDAVRSAPLWTSPWAKSGQVNAGWADLWSLSGSELTVKYRTVQPAAITAQAVHHVSPSQSTAVADVPFERVCV